MHSEPHWRDLALFAFIVIVPLLDAIRTRRNPWGYILVISFVYLCFMHWQDLFG